jgi:nitrogen regulatory protein PII
VETLEPLKVAQRGWNSVQIEIGEIQLFVSKAVIGDDAVPGTIDAVIELVRTGAIGDVA